MQRYFAINKIDDYVVLSDNDFHHIINVMRMNDSDEIEVVYDGILYKAMIDDIKSKSVKVIEKMEHSDEVFPHITLIIPALKEQKLDFIFQKCTEIGVDEFVVAPFERSIIKYDERKEKVKLERWKKICKEASEQSKRVDIPCISLEHSLDFIKNIDGLKLICSTNEKENYIKYALNNKSKYDKITLVIGPEGGISSKEEEYYELYGFKKVTLGTQIMRAETVPIFLTSIIKYEYTE